MPINFIDLWGYWNWGWAQVWEPGYERTDRVVKIATNVYDLTQDKLVWASESEAFNPRTLKTAIADVVKVIAK